MNWFLMVNLRYGKFDGYHISMSLVDSNPFSNTELCSPLCSRLKKNLFLAFLPKRKPFSTFGSSFCRSRASTKSQVGGICHVSWVFLQMWRCWWKSDRLIMNSESWVSVFLDIAGMVFLWKVRKVHHLHHRPFRMAGPVISTFRWLFYLRFHASLSKNTTPAFQRVTNIYTRIHTMTCSVNLFNLMWWKICLCRSNQSLRFSHFPP